MANGELVVRAAGFEHYKLIDAISATSNGQWIGAGEYAEGSLTAILAGTATVKVMASDEASMPSNTAHGYQVGSDITASGNFTITSPARWIKAYISAHGSGQVDVLCTLRRR